MRLSPAPAAGNVAQVAVAAAIATSALRSCRHMAATVSAPPRAPACVADPRVPRGALNAQNAVDPCSAGRSRPVPRKETTSMVARKTALPLALVTSAALALPGAQAMAKGPVAHSAGGDVAALNPSVIGTAITRTDAALGAAADAIDMGDGATAGKPLTAARRYLIRSYVGAKY